MCQNSENLQRGSDRSISTRGAEHRFEFLSMVILHYLLCFYVVISFLLKMCCNDYRSPQRALKARLTTKSNPTTKFETSGVGTVLTGSIRFCRPQLVRRSENNQRWTAQMDWSLSCSRHGCRSRCRRSGWSFVECFCRQLSVRSLSSSKRWRCFF